MIDLGTTELFIAGPTLPRGDFEDYSTRLFDDWEARLQRDLSVPDYSLSLEVEEGSVTAIAAVGATLFAIYLGIGNYGSFVAGLETITKQVRAAGEYLSEQATAPFTQLNIQPRVRRRTGDLGRIQRLFRRVQKQELSVEAAMAEAEAVLRADATSPEFMQRLAETLTAIGRHPQQLLLPMELPDEVDVSPPREAAAKDRPSRTAPQLPESARLRLRVEVWRESRTGKREIRITEL